LLSLKNGTFHLPATFGNICRLSVCWLILMMLSRSTIQLLRFPFSFFLMPVYLFAVSQVPSLNITDTILIFFILHLLVYPASNGFNSYMDRDTGPIGGIENPMPATRQLLHTAAVMDLLAICLSLLVSLFFTMAMLIYILASRAYSARTIRIKRYPVAGYLLVAICQGSLTWIMVYHGCSLEKLRSFPILPVLAASLLIGGFYPLTQVYQHEQDRKDGVTTISMLLGYRGTFVFTAIVYTAAMGLLFTHFEKTGQEMNFFVLASIMLPVLVYFFIWASKVWKDYRQADFKHAMRMNLLASVCTNLAFIIIIIRRFL
jgi:1,4-dihydroxy-2-naphthoate octaprenyltransferase